jgi:hypothetical protein
MWVRRTSAILAMGLSGCTVGIWGSTPPLSSGSTPDTPAPTQRAATRGSARLRFVWSPAARQPASAPLLVATDPDQDSVWFAAPSGPPVRIALSTGDSPGDVAIGWRTTATSTVENVVYVSLRGGGAVLSIPISFTAPTAPITYSRLPICREPRGLDAYPNAGGSASRLAVACADGTLAIVDSAMDSIVSVLPLDDDLRDVVVLDGQTAWVTQFRSANLLVVDLVTGIWTASPLPGGPSRVADVAWQMVELGGFPRTAAIIAHQLASTAPITVPGATTGASQTAAAPAPGGGAGAPTCSVCTCDDGSCPLDATGSCIDGSSCLGPLCSQNDYGAPPPECFSDDPGSTSGMPCNVGIVAAAATIVQPPAAPGGAPRMTQVGVLSGVGVPLNILNIPESTGSDQLAVINGIGNQTGRTVDIHEALAAPGGSESITCLQPDPCGGYNFGILAMDIDPVTGDFAFLEPSRIFDVFASSNYSKSATYDLPIQALRDEEGRNLFYRVTPSMTSCASCHPDGRDDGRTWNFVPMGKRRTPSLGGGLLATAPFHWDGAEADVEHLVNDVFVGRMKAEAPSADEIASLSDWLNTIPVAQSHAMPDPIAVGRGKTLFESPALGCASCHSGPHFTNNLTLDVGTGGSFQVPSLLGLGSRPPYLHDGRAPTLADRFGPSGGGDQHGHTSQLSPSDIADLAAYLRTL